ncbi:hypothetical protein [Mesorhizobium sp. WSM3224]|uniref:hypothetical protein n=1 Tax=Mesorhizobium sp. WSM3224 TaxID=1040986 RepID=UPI00041D7F61|nr:hypothetical protein [Mesorhizobium sp. WSM3224]
MAAVVVAIGDRDNWDANTDIIVVADVSRRRLTWVPRDLWSPLISDRVNAAFAIGGGRLLGATVNPPGENPNASSPASLQPDLERNRDRG